MKTGPSIAARLLIRAAKILDEPQLNSSLCLIFNGMASMIAIVFLVRYCLDKTAGLLWLGIAGCLCITLANTTDLFPFWLSNFAKKLGKEA